MLLHVIARRYRRIRRDRVNLLIIFIMKSLLEGMYRIYQDL